MADRRKHWGWGLESEQPSRPNLEAAAEGLAAHLGFGRTEVEDPVAIDALELPEPRIGIPAELKANATDATYDRARYGLGRSYSDVVRGMRGEIPFPPDFVVHAWTDTDVQKTLEWAAE